MQDLTEVAPVGIATSSVDAVIDPLPDESTMHAVTVEVRVEAALLVGVEFSGAITHRMGELAHEEGQPELASRLRSRLGPGHDGAVPHGLDPLHGRIHDRPYIADGVGVVPLVVGETGWVTILNPVVHKTNAFATVGFVAHRPPDDGGMILVAFDGALNAVK